MSSPSHAAHDAGHESHGAHGHHGPDHVPHILPLSMYFAVGGGLLFLTFVTVWVSYFDFGSFNLLVALAVAGLKASLVALFFMHLWWDHKFNAVIFVSSLLFLAVFIGFTMFDTETRGDRDEIKLSRPRNIAQPFDGFAPDVGGMRGVPAKAPAQAE